MRLEEKEDEVERRHGGITNSKEEEGKGAEE